LAGFHLTYRKKYQFFPSLQQLLLRFHSPFQEEEDILVKYFLYTEPVCLISAGLHQTYKKK